MPSFKIALTATVIDLDDDFEDWCAYNLGHFDRMILWLDDHQAIDSPRIPRNGSVVALPGNQHSSPNRHTDLMRRQNANADAALRLCLEAGIEWLVHLDQDEILHLISDDLWDTDAGQITFLNHEVCPVWSAERMFRDCRHFRLNGRGPFRLYGNGKSAVRCHPDVRSDGAHFFQNFKGRSITTKTPCILHYACATYASWLRKYSRLGHFEPFWYDDPATPISLRFHLDLRDACHSALTSGDFAIARNFFKRHVLSEDEMARLDGGGRRLLSGSAGGVASTSAR